MDTNTSDSGLRILESRSAAETESVAAGLGALLSGGEVLALIGPLGAGKTLFVKGLATSLDIDARDVTSPTFLIIHQLRGRLELFHLDAYRVSGPDELQDLGVADCFQPDAVVAVEWAERADGILPADRLVVRLSHAGPKARKIELRATGPRHLLLLHQLLARLDAERETP